MRVFGGKVKWYLELKKPLTQYYGGTNLTAGAVA